MLAVLAKNKHPCMVFVNLGYRRLSLIMTHML